MLRICFPSDTRETTWRLPWSRSALAAISFNMLYSARQECVARALNRRAASLFQVDTCIFPRDKTGLTMGKPEVNPTNNKVRVLGYTTIKF